MDKEIKRSSWNAGMAANLLQLPPGSPAWQERRRSRPDEPLRSRSPTRLPPIRSVSGPALESEQFEDIPLPQPSPDSPFQFQSTYVTPVKPRARACQRRGHHYKHSSVSLNFFLEPERAPLSIPVSLAVPTLREYWQSVTPRQLARLGWCVLRAAAALVVYAAASPVHAVGPLAHLVAYETVVSITVSLVAVLANFDVWKQSSLRLPFALERAEVLVAFGLAAVLLFIGANVLSHLIQHAIEHHEHEIQDGELTHYVTVLLSMLTVLPSAIKGNRIAVATAVIAAVVLVVPALPPGFAQLVDSTLSPLIALTMIYMGWTTAKLFGGMLVMSYGGPDKSEDIVRRLRADHSVEEVRDISLWQLHQGLWMASMKIKMRGTVSDERRVRELVSATVRELYDLDVEWQTTIEIENMER